tara:strand:- start:117 stop:278 length:162 start_codon:yes stop_codon:yes gene_type:complete
MAKEIQHWTIKVTWEDKEEEYLSDIPDWVARNIDDYLIEVEYDKNEENEEENE